MIKFSNVQNPYALDFKQPFILRLKSPSAKWIKEESNETHITETVEAEMLPS